MATSLVRSLAAQGRHNGRVRGSSGTRSTRSGQTTTVPNAYVAETLQRVYLAEKNRKAILRCSRIKDSQVRQICVVTMFYNKRFQLENYDGNQPRNEI